jgi:hypothetical protein
MLQWLTHNIDYFSCPVQITFHNQDKYSSLMGKILSIMIYGVTLSLIITSWNSLLNKKNPKTSMTNSYQTDSPLMNISELNSVYIANFLTRDYLPFKDSSYFTIEANLFEVKRYTNATATFNDYALKQVNCSLYKEKYKNKGFENDFTNNNLDEAVCIDLNSQDIVLGGSFIGQYFSNFNYKIKKCVNYTDSNIICKSSSEIDEKIKGGFFMFYYFDNYVDLNDYSKIFKESFMSYFILLDPKASKFVDLYFKYVNISSDIGLIFESKEYTSAVAFDYYKEQIDTSSTSNLIIEFYVNSSRNYLTYTRIYMKFQEFAATIGGLLKIMTFLGSIITSKFTKFEMLEKMFNSIFEFGLKSGKSNMKNLKIIDENSNQPMINNMITKKDEIINKIPFQTTNLEKIELVKLLKSKLSTKNDDKKEIKLGTFQLIKMHLCFCTKNQKEKWNILILAYRKLTKYIDYLKISSTLQQYNRMKKILLTDAQRKMLSISSKPKILIEKSEKNIKDQENDDEKIASLFYNYVEIRENKNDPINLKLLDFIDYRYKLVFENII